MVQLLATFLVFLFKNLTQCILIFWSYRSKRCWIFYQDVVLLFCLLFLRILLQQPNTQLMYEITSTMKPLLILYIHLHSSNSTAKVKKTNKQTNKHINECAVCVLCVHQTATGQAPSDRFVRCCALLNIYLFHGRHQTSYPQHWVWSAISTHNFTRLWPLKCDQLLVTLA